MYTLREPAPALRPYIEHYWFVATTAAAPLDLSVDVYVDARADLILNFGVPYTRTAAGEAPVEIARSNLDAQRRRPIRVEQRGAIVVSGARFRTGGLAPFVRAPLSQFTDRTVPLDEAFGPEAVVLEAALRAAGTDPTHQTRLLDDFFHARFELGAGARTLLTLMARIEAEGGLDRMDALCADAGVSARHLTRLFQTHLGVGPKTFARIVRFQRALSMLRADPGCTLAAVAATCGYYDQPHFVREFRACAGVAPRERVGYFPAGGPADFSPNVVRFVQDPREKAREAAALTPTPTPENTMAISIPTKDAPLTLKTPPQTSEFTMHRDTAGGREVLVCTVGKTVLHYDLRCVADLHAMLLAHGDWMELGSADEQKPAKDGTVEAWGRSADNPVGGWYGLKKGLRGRFGMYLPPLLEALGLAEVTHDARGNRMRALARVD
jgi:AraC-like DNA-binding protein